MNWTSTTKSHKPEHWPRCSRGPIYKCFTTDVIWLGKYFVYWVLASAVAAVSKVTLCFDWERNLFFLLFYGWFFSMLLHILKLCGATELKIFRWNRLVKDTQMSTVYIYIIGCYSCLHGSQYKRQDNESIWDPASTFFFKTRSLSLFCHSF